MAKRTLEVVLVGDSANLKRTLGQANRELSGFGNKMNRTWAGIGKAAKIGGAAVAGAGVAAVKSAIDFESAFAGVRKTVDATEKQYRQLSDGIRRMSREIPVAANEIAGIAEAAGQLGIQRKNILGFTRVMADLGVATNLSGEEAATALARLANITQMSQGDFDRLGSTIVALGNNLATTESEIVDMGLRIAGAGKQIGLSESQILGFSGALSSVGIAAEAGGSAISKTFVEIASSVASGGGHLEGFAEVAGVTATEFQKRFKDDAAGATIAFIEGLGRIKDEGGNVFGVLEDLGITEVRMRDALLRASGAGDLFRKSLRLSGGAWKENNALTKEAEQRYRTTESQLKILRNTIVDMGVTVGSKLLPPVTDAVKAVSAFASGMLDGKGAGGQFRDVLESIGAVASQGFEWVRNAAQDWLPRLVDGFNAAKDTAAGWANSQLPALQALGQAARDVASVLFDVGSAVVSAGQKIAPTVLEVVKFAAKVVDATGVVRNLVPVLAAAAGGYVAFKGALAAGAAIRTVTGAVGTLTMGMGALRSVYVAQTGVTNASTAAVIKHAFATKGATAVTGGFSKAMHGLTAAMRANPIGAVATVVGTLAGAFAFLSLRSSEAEVSTRELTDAFRQQADAMREVRDIDLDVAQRRANLKSATVAVAQAEKRLRQSRKDSKASALDVKQAEADLEQARVQQQRAQRDLARSEEDQKRKRDDAGRATDDLRGKIKQSIKQRQDELDGLKSQVERFEDLSRRGGKWADKLDQLRAKQKSLREEIGRLNRRLADVGKAGEEAGRALSEGMARGMTDGITGLINSADNMADTLVRRVRRRLRVESPSKVFQEIGNFIGQGLALGIQGSKAIVNSAINEGLLFPLDAAIRELERKRERLEERWRKADEKLEAQRLRREIRLARRTPLDVTTIDGGVGGGAGSRGGSGVRGNDAVEWAKSVIGQFAESTGPNTGDQLDKLQKEFGMRAEAWCAMFVSKALQKAGLPVKTASVAQLVAWAKSGASGFQKGVRPTGRGARPGDVWVDPTQAGHTGLIVGVDAARGVVRTVEGNTSAGKVAPREHKFGEGFTLRPSYGGSRRRPNRSSGASVAGASWATAVLDGLGIEPTPAAIKALLGWEKAEGKGKGGRNNPLNTSQGMPGDSVFNSHGVRNYPNLATGVSATIKTLKNGRYQPILDALTRGASPEQFVAAVNASPWGTKTNFASLIRSSNPGGGSRVSGNLVDDSSRRESVKQATEAWKDFNKQLRRAAKQRRIDFQIRGLEKMRDWNDALKQVADTLEENVSQAVDSFREKWEQTTGRDIDRANAKLLQKFDDLADQARQKLSDIHSAALSAFDAETARLVANSPAARALAALQAEADAAKATSEAEDRQRALEEARRSGDPRAIRAAQEAIAEADRQARITELQRQAEAEREAIEAQRAAQRIQREREFAAEMLELERAQADERQALEDEMAAKRLATLNAEAEAFKTKLKGDLDAEYRTLVARGQNYAAFVNNVNRHLNRIGDGSTSNQFVPDASAEAALSAGPAMGVAFAPGSAGWNAAWEQAFRDTHRGISVAEWAAGKRASGGLINKAGVYRVGELGPEAIFRTPAGGLAVQSASRMAMQRGGQGGPLVHIEHAEIGSQRAAERLAHTLSFDASYRP